MKTTSKIGLFGVMAAAFIANPLAANAETNVLPAAVNGKITLEDDVVIRDKAVLNASGSSLTIDLNGHKLIRDGYRGYLIDNRGILTITDSSSNKGGTIECRVEPNDPKNPSSCVRNYDKLDVDNVTIKANWTALKNEEGSNLTIKNSIVDSTTGSRSNTAGAIMNYGALSIDGSKVLGANIKDGAAIFSLTYVEGDKVYSSSAVIKNSEISAYWPVIIEQGDETKPLAEGEKATVVFENGTIKTSSEEGARIARIQEQFARSNNDAFKLTLTGNITASSQAMEYLEGNATLTLNENVEEELVIPEGITLIVPENVEVAEGTIKMEKGAVIKNESGKDLSVILLGDEEKEVVVKNDETFDGTFTQPEDPKDPSDEPGSEPNEPENPNDNDELTNPKTFDGVTVYSAVALAMIGGLGFVLKKSLN